MRDEHIRKNDYFCPRCKLMVMIHIPHECDPSVCYACNGYGIEWNGASCIRCEGSGKTIFRDDEGEGIERE